MEYPKDIHDLIMNDAITIWITEAIIDRQFGVLGHHCRATQDDLISGLTTYLFQQLVCNFGGLTTTMCSGSLFANWWLCPHMYWCVMDG
ncbi:hypothetical protein Godav_010060 [Gossypium davidsonii]|uniref:Uncharacterized protein n=2 Tax=Gossypium TaxID=3633 RepID=A0A7J8SF98_GOSDV|nr:hypothetical protein [Gossypium davidsonii]